MNELVHLRTRRSKVFDRPRAPLEQLLGTVKRRMVISAIGALHWHDGQTWRDVDLAWTLRDGKYVVPSAHFEAAFDPETYTLHYRSLAKGDMRVRLATINGAPPSPAAPSFFPDRTRMRYLDVAPGVSLVVVARPAGPEIMRRFTGPVLPEIVWQISESEARSEISTNFASMVGVDNHDQSSVGRGAEVLQRNKNRFVEVSSVRSADSVVNGRRNYTVTEQLTGRTRWRDPITRAPEWREEIEFPVFLDVQVIEDIATGVDDGWGEGTSPEYWKTPSFDYTVHMDTAAWPGWRFQTVNVPQGATIDNATLRVNVTDAGDMTAPLYGNDVDDAASWTDGQMAGPNGMTKTAASITFDGFSATGLTTRTVTSLVQEIVDRAGWVANNDMRLACTTPSGSNAVRFRAYEGDPANAGRLTIDYTAAGGAGHPTARRHGGIPGMQPRSFGRSW